MTYLGRLSPLVVSVVLVGCHLFLPLDPPNDGALDLATDAATAEFGADIRADAGLPGRRVSQGTLLAGKYAIAHDGARWVVLWTEIQGNERCLTLSLVDDGPNPVPGTPKTVTCYEVPQMRALWLFPVKDGFRAFYQVSGTYGLTTVHLRPGNFPVPGETKKLPGYYNTPDIFPTETGFGLVYYWSANGGYQAHFRPLGMDGQPTATAELVEEKTTLKTDPAGCWTPKGNVVAWRHSSNPIAVRTMVYPGGEPSAAVLDWSNTTLKLNKPDGPLSLTWDGQSDLLLTWNDDDGPLLLRLGLDGKALWTEPVRLPLNRIDPHQEHVVGGGGQVLVGWGSDEKTLRQELHLSRLSLPDLPAASQLNGGLPVQKKIPLGGAQARPRMARGKTGFGVVFEATPAGYPELFFEVIPDA